MYRERKLDCSLQSLGPNNCNWFCLTQIVLRRKNYFSPYSIFYRKISKNYDFEENVNKNASKNDCSRTCLTLHSRNNNIYTTWYIRLSSKRISWVGIYILWYYFGLLVFAMKYSIHLSRRNVIDHSPGSWVITSWVERPYWILN